MNTEELKAVVALPEPARVEWVPDKVVQGDVLTAFYTEDQMHAYALARIEAATAPVSGLSGEEREALEREEGRFGCASLNITQHFADVMTICAALRRLAAPADSLGVDDAMVLQERQP